MWGSYYNLPKAIFYLRKGNYKCAHASPSSPTQAWLDARVSQARGLHVKGSGAGLGLRAFSPLGQNL